MRLTSLRPITAAGERIAFGYYDRCPWSPDLRLHLALAMPQEDHLPQPGEEARLGVIDLAGDGAFRQIATTRAWNHQQGCMSMWLRNEPGCVVFNDRDGERVYARVIDGQGRDIRRLPRPVYNLSPDGRWALSLDFARLQRRGYSYAIANPAEHGGCGLPADDGLWIMDVRTGDTRLLCSYRDMAALHPVPHELAGAFCWADHPAFNCDGSRVFVLLRYYMTAADGSRTWRTYLYTVGIDGSGLRCRLPHPWWKCSHHAWGRTPDEILVDQNLAGMGGEFTVFKDSDAPLRFERLAPGSIQHGHQWFSPDHRWLLTDTYPDAQGLQHLRLAEVSSGRTIELAAMSHPRRTRDEEAEWRCDLHPRWRPDGRALSFDSMHDGSRRIWIAELAE